MTRIATVRTELELRLVVPGGPSLPVLADLRYAADDPWGTGQTLEWATSSPAPGDNFADVHIISSAEPLLDLKPLSTSARTEGAA